jgi:hypothetical protein
MPTTKRGIAPKEITQHTHTHTHTHTYTHEHLHTNEQECSPQVYV